ncbi:MAG TPA: hypothetical protein DCS48_07595 [Desulfovibrio sp.]|nr:hypothetical protein [Desulfovibrio sp.]
MNNPIYKGYELLTDVNVLNSGVYPSKKEKIPTCKNRLVTLVHEVSGCSRSKSTPEQLETDSGCPTAAPDSLQEG